MTSITTITLQGSIQQMRTRIATEQGAMHQVQLNVARWRGAASDCQPLHEAVPAMAAGQVAWHAAAQCHFLRWLAEGGFAQASAEAQAAEAKVTAAPQASPDACQQPHNCNA